MTRNQALRLRALAGLGADERVRLWRSAKDAQKLETEWLNRLDAQLRKFDELVFEQLYERGVFRAHEIDFLPFVLEHSFEAMSEGLREVRRYSPEEPHSKLAGPPRGPRVPLTLGELKALYDKWRKRRDVPPRQKKIAEKLKRDYLKRVQSVWQRHSEDFRQSKVFNMDAVREVFRSQGDMARSRARTIVQTETTFYYNKVRRDYYDRSGDVTHYLFVAIRDKATTKWCSTRQGVVFEKGTKLLEQNTPPCHWNCRSEMLPLTPLNPRHLAMIKDPSRKPSNRHLHPLPKGWNGSRAA